MTRFLWTIRRYRFLRLCRRITESRKLDVYA